MLTLNPGHAQSLRASRVTLSPGGDHPLPHAHGQGLDGLWSEQPPPSQRLRGADAFALPQRLGPARLPPSTPREDGAGEPALAGLCPCSQGTARLGNAALPAALARLPEKHAPVGEPRAHFPTGRTGDERNALSGEGETAEFRAKHPQEHGGSGATLHPAAGAPRESANPAG